jgi:hypothetical protein
LRDARRWVGFEGARRLLEAFAGFTCLPDASRFRSARIIGPCATFAVGDTWTDTPFVDGVLLVGDAADYNDPSIRQLAFRSMYVGPHWLPAEILTDAFHNALLA